VYDLRGICVPQALNGELKPFHHSYVLGKHVKHSSTWEDLSLVDALYESRGSVPCVKVSLHCAIALATLELQIRSGQFRSIEDMRYCVVLAGQDAVHG